FRRAPFARGSRAICRSQRSQSLTPNAAPQRMNPARRPPRTIPSLRWWIVALLFASTVINYIDRQTLSLLAPFLKREHGWTNTDYANIVVAFRVAYAIGQHLSGRLKGPGG